MQIRFLYRRSTDGGATFGPTINLSNDVPSSLQPTIAVSDGIVHVAWADDITDGGVSFTEPIKNLSGSAGQSARPAIAVSGNMVHVVWDDSTTGNRDILYRRSLDGGSTFPNIIKNLSGDPEGSSFPAIAVSGNNVHVVWNAGSEGGNFDILYRRSLDGGSTFPNIIKNLSNNMGISGFAAIAVSGNNLHVVWEDDTPDPLRDILYMRSTDGGATFTDPIKNLSSNGGQSHFPAIALSGNNVYVVWYDNTIGGYQVLYRTSSNSGDTFPPILTNLSENAGISLANLGPGIGVS